MIVCLVWERESYCDYDVIKVFSDKEKAEKYIQSLGETDNTYFITERVVE
jgi:hypothetical protein